MYYTEDLEGVLMAYGIYEIELPDLIFPETWRGKYSNPATNFICCKHGYCISIDIGYFVYNSSISIIYILRG